jgi:hypothetical protein
MEKTGYQRLNIQLDLPTYEQLQDLSAQTRVPVADLIRQCIARAFEDVKKDAFNDPQVRARAQRLATDALRTLQKSEE